MQKSVNVIIFIFFIGLISPVFGAFNARVLHGPSIGATMWFPDTYGIRPGYEVTYINWVGLWASAGYRHAFLFKGEFISKESQFPAPYIEFGIWPDMFSFFKDGDKKLGFRFGLGLSLMVHQDIPIVNPHLFLGLPIQTNGDVVEPFVRYVILSSKDALKRSIFEIGIQYRFVNILGKVGLIGL